MRAALSAAFDHRLLNVLRYDVWRSRDHVKSSCPCTVVACCTRTV
jgi:hypothetical protein